MADPEDEDWLLTRERGADVSHVAPGTRARYEQLDQLIAALPERTPPVGWKQRVLDALDAPAPRSSSDALAAPSPRSSSQGHGDDAPSASPRSGRAPTVRGWRAWLLAAGGAVAGIVIVTLALPRGTNTRGVEPVVTTELRRAGSAHRGDDAAVGDTLVVRAQGGPPIELRVYGEGGEPLARCTDAQGCKVERTGARRTYTLELLLRSPGDVRAVLFIGDPIPEPTSNLDADLAAALTAHIDARQVAIVHVQ